VTVSTHSTPLMNHRLSTIETGPVSVSAHEMIYNSYKDTVCMLDESERIVVVELGPVLSSFMIGLSDSGYVISDNNARIIFAITAEVCLMIAALLRDGVITEEGFGRYGLNTHTLDVLWEELECAASTDYLIDIRIEETLILDIIQSICIDDVIEYIINHTKVGTEVRPYRWIWCGNSTVLHTAIA